jgi:hypothetical protein
MSEHILTIEQVRRIIMTEELGGMDRIIASHDLLDRKYRRTLWMQHGCPIAQAFDDTTMQCGGRHEFPDDARFKPHGPLDFHKDTILDLETELAKMKLAESGVRIPNLNDEPWRWPPEKNAVQTAQDGI